MQFNKLWRLLLFICSDSRWSRNGKHVTLDGKHVENRNGADLYWGVPGTNGQPLVYQLIHRGSG